MEWNADNQLKRVLKNGVEQARFSYDPHGRRVEKVAGGVTTSYLYDGQDILREVRGGATLKYVQGPGIDQPLAREDGSGALTYYHADGLSSIVKRTSQAGAVVHQYRYDAWGNIEAGASEAGYAFTGREREPETGLYYYRARYYDSSAGRFLSEDPARHSGGLNFSTYVANNPISNLDPTGNYTIRTDSQPFDKAAQDAIGKILSEVVDNPEGCPCLGWFARQGGDDLLTQVVGGKPPDIKYDNTKPWHGSGLAGYTRAPWDSLWLIHGMAVQEDSCLVASFILHEMAHIAQHDRGVSDWEGFVQACSVGCMVPAALRGPGYH